MRKYICVFVDWIVFTRSKEMINKIFVKKM
jgi:hypothetical protein